MMTLIKFSNNVAIPNSRENPYQLIGQTFGELTVQCREIVNNISYWKCKCSCGRIKLALSNELMSGRRSTCGVPLMHKSSYVNKDGYRKICVPGHPRAKKGYVSEHVVVMERIIGRYLLDGETVHHKNGQRQDNEPDNLELWVSNHPPGQRVQDLLQWANTIIARYGNEQNKR